MANIPISDKPQKEWKAFCDAVGLEMKPLLWHFVTKEVFKKILQAKVKAACSIDASGEAVNAQD